MKKAVFWCVAVLAAALFCGVGSASADGVQFGVNDDAGMFAKGGGPFFGTLTSLGMHNNTVTVRWDETTASGFENLCDSAHPDCGVTLQPFLPSTVAAAGLAGVNLTFDVYPRHSLAAGDPTTNAPKFAAWLTTLAQTYPSVTHYVVMNECNQPLFVNPQYDASGKLLSAADCGQFLAAGYNALKAVNPDIFVWGVGLSPHGAKVDGQPGHRDSDPFSFLAALGDWDKTSNGGAKIMDGLDVHPYPIPQSTPFAQGNSNAYGPAFGVATLPLVYQAFYDAFNGTSQPTVGPGHLPVSLNEVGIQTQPTIDGYSGTETLNWGIDATTGNQDFQAKWYKQMIDTVQCDADVTNVNIFKLIDQPNLDGWQSGLFQLGWAAKESARVVADEIRTVTSCPSGVATTWAPASSGSTGSTGLLSAAQLAAMLRSNQYVMQSVSPILLQLFSMNNVKLELSYSSLNSYVSALSDMLGTATTSLKARLQLALAASVSVRSTASARPKHPKPAKGNKPVSVQIKAGQTLKVPKLKGIKAGTYRLQLTFTGSAGTGTIVTKPFALSKTGKMTFAGPKAKPKAKPHKKGKAKPAHGKKR